MRTMDRIPARGITRKEHDDFVKMTGRNYTDPYIWPHLNSRGPTAGGIVPPHARPDRLTDPKVHAPSIG